MNSLSVSILLLVSMILSRTLALCQANETTLFAGDIRVTAVLRDVPVDRFFYTFEIVVSRDGDNYSYSSIVPAGSDEDAISRMKKGIGWKAGYFFVRTECGGGNAWRCSKEHVFAIRKNRLIHIGAILGGDREDGPGKYYENGFFVDLYDKFEINALTSHAGSPGIWLYLRPVGDHLQVDLDETWRRNQERFDENVAQVERASDPRSSEPSQQIAEPLLQGAVLAKYCDHPAVLKNLTTSSRSILDEQSYGIFLKILANVVPGELPKDNP